MNVTNVNRVQIYIVYLYRYVLEYIHSCFHRAS